jgi:hypothetical protein|tara:strand:- start:10783 stop:11409 length:627 start_codon:yes stop_codon:yes gene_type:complete
MRNTRNIIAEQAQRIINGGTATPDVEVRKEELVVFVDQVFTRYIKQSFYENRQEGSRYINGSFIYSFTEDVQYDKIRKRHFAEIPSTYVNLPLGIGLYQVSPVEDEYNSMIPVNPNFLAMSNGLAVGSLEGKKGYFVENTTMIFVNVPTSYKMKSVLIKLVGGVQGEVDPENIDIPVDAQADMVEMVVRLYTQQGQTAIDEVNNNNKK